MILTFVSIVIIGAIIDVISLYALTGRYFKKQLYPILRIENGVFKPRSGAALFIYLSAAISIVFFVLPRINPAEPVSSALLWGALMGLSLYGVYEFVSYTVLKEWKLGVVIVDLIWGTCFVAGLSVAAYHLHSIFTL